MTCLISVRYATTVSSPGETSNTYAIPSRHQGNGVVCRHAPREGWPQSRALTTLIANGMATIVISRWEGELERCTLHETMAYPLKIGKT